MNGLDSIIDKIKGERTEASYATKHPLDENLRTKIQTQSKDKPRYVMDSRTNTSLQSSSDLSLSWKRHNDRLTSTLFSLRNKSRAKLTTLHGQTPYIRRLPLPAILIISSLIMINLITWSISFIILSSRAHLISTAALAYSLGLRHALDADHITAIDLMTRRLISTGQRPVTVGTYFSLGHSTIVVVTSIVVAATAAGITTKFDSFSTVGGIVGSSISAAFLTVLGVVNAYILWKLIVQLFKVVEMLPEDPSSEKKAWTIQGRGCLFRVLRQVFKLIDKPWKMYPLGILFGLGFDTSSEIALLGISSVQATRGTSMWLILIFPVLFTAGMCLVDTVDGALMMSLYVAPLGFGGGGQEQMVVNEVLRSRVQVEDEEHAPPTLLEDLPRGDQDDEIQPVSKTTHEDLHKEAGMSFHPSAVFLTDRTSSLPRQTSPTKDATHENTPVQPSHDHPAHHPIETVSATQAKDPLTFLYYSIILTFLTVVCALIIGILQFLSLLLNVIRPTPTGRFWDGVATAGDNYDLIGGGICASFVVVGGMSLVLYPKFKGWVERRRDRIRRKRSVELPRGLE